MKAISKFIETGGARVHPLLFLVICILAFGLFIPFLGFYWDDWPTIFYTYSQRAGQLATHFSYDRPFSVWTYWLIGRLGSAPLTWHVAALLLRWACVLALAWALKPLWPKHSKLILFTGLLFAIYPGYYLQPSAATFSAQLFAYLFFLVSLGAMGRAAANKERFWVYMAAGLGAAAVHMFTLEYFVGLELIRPFYLWFLLSRARHGAKPVKQTLRLWAPYLALFIVWLVWRLFLLDLPADPYPLVALSAFKETPITAALDLIGVAVKDLGYVLISTWKDTVIPGIVTVPSNVNAIAWVFAGGCFLLLWWALARLQAGEGNPSGSRKNERRAGLEAATLGGAALVTGLLPIWLIGEDIAHGEYDLRYMLAALLGAALLLAGMIILFLRSSRAQILTLSLLAALALGNHLRAGAEYQQDWETQRQFFWQLHWRAPAFEANTALVAFEPVSRHLRDPMTGAALNVLYPTAGETPVVGLWNFELDRTQTVTRIQNGELLDNNYRGLIFSGATAEDLVFYYLPPGGCLWVLSPRDASNKFLRTQLRDLAGASNPENILAQAEERPPAHIFGAEPAHDWCFYYEKAALAAQLKDWPRVVELMAEARELGLSSSYGVEWLPLLEAHAASGDWAQAIETSEFVHRMHPSNDSVLCAMWAAMLEADPNPAAAAAFDRVSLLVSCESQ